MLIKISQWISGEEAISDECVRLLKTVAEKVLIAEASKTLVSEKTVLQTLRLSSKKPQVQLISFDHTLIKTGDDQWHIMEKIPLGRGSFGAVYPSKYKIILEGDSVRIAPTDDVVKVQILPLFSDKTRNRQQILEEIERERQGLVENKLDAKPLIVFGHEVYLVMPNVGESLDKCMPDPSLFDFDQSFQMAYGLLNDMFALRGHERIHRDLKPANICRRSIQSARGISYQYIYIDFGLSIKQNDSEEEIAGTPYYMAPELLDGNGHSSYASDVYSLAGIFLQIFGVTKLFTNKAKNFSDGYSLTGLFGEHLDRSNVVIPNDVDRLLLDDFRQLFLQMFATDPSLRPSVEFIIKFFSGVEHRRDWNRKYNELFALVDSYSKQLGIPFSKQQPCLPSHLAEVERLLGMTINSNLIDLYPAEHVHYQKTRAQAVLYQSTIAQCQALFAKLITPTLFAGTNSTGIRKIQKLLANSQKGLIPKLLEIKQIGQQKIKQNWFNCYSRWHFFGRGRHPNVDKFYEQLALLSVEPGVLPDQNQIDSITSLSHWLQQKEEERESFVFRGTFAHRSL